MLHEGRVAAHGNAADPAFAARAERAYFGGEAPDGPESPGGAADPPGAQDRLEAPTATALEV